MYFVYKKIKKHRAEKKSERAAQANAAAQAEPQPPSNSLQALPRSFQEWISIAAGIPGPASSPPLWTPATYLKRRQGFRRKIPFSLWRIIKSKSQISCVQPASFKTFKDRQTQTRLAVRRALLVAQAPAVKCLKNEQESSRSLSGLSVRQTSFGSFKPFTPCCRVSSTPILSFSLRVLFPPTGFSLSRQCQARLREMGRRGCRLGPASARALSLTNILQESYEICRSLKLTNILLVGA
ncbi:hypothetical protein B0H10DRAFT_2388991 [Mycena sp. CBHHK59/15]|nr:hypothetical protein B0H10DRAFT_2388991 [Mycena sp. CBHHK59/15]